MTQPSFMSLMLAEMGVRIGLFLLAMVLAFVGAALVGGEWRILGAVAGLVVGGVVYAVVIRRFNDRPTPTP